MKHTFMAVVASAAFATLVPAGSFAAVPPDLAAMDCSQGGAMMSMAPKPDSAMMASPSAAMTTDQAFMGAMGPMMHHSAMMAGMELKCGKDATARAHAAKLLQQLSEDGSMEAKDILNTYNH